MTLFLVVAGLLLVGVVAMLLYPLLRKSDRNVLASAKARELNLAILREQRAELERDYAEGGLDAAAYEKAREELERRTLEDAGAAARLTATSGRRLWLAGGVGVLVPAVVVSLYVFLGEPAALSERNPAATAEGGSHALTPQQIQGMVEKLAERLQESPNDGQGWLMLAKSYAVLGRYPESVAAYGRAVALLPPDAQVMADFADTLAMAQGRTLQGEPEKLIRRALEIDPKNIKALALAGTIAFDRQDYPGAIGEWRKVLALVPADSSVATGIQGSIRDAENRLAVAGSKVEQRNVKDEMAAGSVSGSVTLDPALAKSVAPGNTLFVFARAVDGPKIPLAIMRKTAADLPLKFTLDDSMAMAPNFRLSQFKQVVVGARISKSGDAMPRSGDLEGLSAPVVPGTANIKIQIGQKVK
jgi:cytochrome c-type biogenesis protein CcmH